MRDGSAEEGPGRAPGARGGLGWSIQRSEVVEETRLFVLTRQWARAADGAVHDFLVLAMPDWVQIVALLSDGRFVMVEQFRHGTRRVTLEFPAGIVESGETPLQCAVRELEEETGYVAGAGEVVGRVDPNAALQDNELFIVVLRDCEPMGEVRQDPRERIRTRIVDPDELDGLIERGEFRDAYGIIAWDFYRRHLG
ncbi:MAG: NUDIX hydrolase [Gemmatimonadota bacterium]